MALARYQHQLALPTYQKADLSGFAAAVNDRSTQISALGMEGQAEMRKAQVLEDFGQKAYAVAADARQREGNEQEIPPLRDAEGNLVPVDTAHTYMIKRDAFNQRVEKAWANEAELEFQNIAQEARKTFADNPAGFTEYMEQKRSDLLKNSPNTISADLDIRFREYSAGIYNGLDAEVFNKTQRNYDASTMQLAVRASKDVYSLAQRDGLKDASGQLSPEFLSAIRRGFSYIGDARPLEKPGLVDSQGRTTPVPTFDALAGKINGEIIRGRVDGLIGNLREDPRLKLDDIALSTALDDVRSKIIAGQTAFPGFKESRYGTGELADITFADLNEAEQNAVVQHIDMMAQDSRNKQGLQKAQVLDGDRRANTQLVRLQRQIQAAQIAPPYAADIEAKAVAAGIDPVLALALTKTESTGNPNAKSGTGAEGLMQVTHGTANDMAKIYGGRGEKDLGDPNWQVTYGVGRLKQMSKIAEERFGWMPASARTAMTVALYHDGPGAADKVERTLRDLGIDQADPNVEVALATKGIRLDDASTWSRMGILEAGAKHAQHTTDVYKAMAGGSAALLEDIMRRQEQQFANNPAMLFELQRQLINDLHQANSLASFNDQMTYKPPPFDATMAKRYVEPTWNQMFDPMHPELAAQVGQSIVQSASANPTFQHLVANETYSQVARAMGSQRTSAFEEFRQVASFVPGDPSPHSRTTAEKLDTLLTNDDGTSGPMTDPFGHFEQLTATQGPNAAAQQMVTRYRMNGKLSNGRPTYEQARFTGTLVQNMAQENMSPGARAAGARFLQLMYQTNDDRNSPMGTARESGLGMVANLIGGPGANNTPESNLLRATKFAMMHGDQLDNDPGARKTLRQILTGQIADDAYGKLPVERKDAFATALSKSFDGSLTNYLGKYAGRMKDTSYISPDVRAWALNRVASDSFLARFREGEEDDAVAAVLEEGFQTGEIGFTTLTRDSFSDSHENYAGFFQSKPNRGPPRGPQIALVVNPVENHLPLGADMARSAVNQLKGDIQLPGGIKVPAREATLLGWAERQIADYGKDLGFEVGMDAALAEAKGQQFFGLAKYFQDRNTVADAFARGDLQFSHVGTKMVNGVTVPTLAIWHKEQIPGTDKVEWRRMFAADATSVAMVGYSQEQSVRAQWDAAKIRAGRMAFGQMGDAVRRIKDLIPGRGDYWGDRWTPDTTINPLAFALPGIGMTMSRGSGKPKETGATSFTGAAGRP